MIKVVLRADPEFRHRLERGKSCVNLADLGIGPIIHAFALL